jgi:hypothetical protein
MATSPPVSHDASSPESDDQGETSPSNDATPRRRIVPFQSRGREAANAAPNGAPARSDGELTEPAAPLPEPTPPSPKDSFILSFPDHARGSEIVAAGEAQGLGLTLGYVHVVRSREEARRRAATPKRVRPKPSATTQTSLPLEAQTAPEAVPTVPATIEAGGQTLVRRPNKRTAAEAALVAEAAAEAEAAKRASLPAARRAEPPQARPRTPPPAKATPAKATPAKATPAKATPAKATPAKATPAKATSPGNAGASLTTTTAPRTVAPSPALERPAARAETRPTPPETTAASSNAAAERALLEAALEWVGVDRAIALLEEARSRVERLLGE